MRVLRKYAVIIFCSVTLESSLADVIATPISLPLHEEYREQVPVSGRLLVGISTLSSAQPSTPNLTLLAPAREKDGMICMQVMSRDGSYWSENTFSLPPGEEGAVSLDYPSRYLEKLYSEQPSDLALMAKFGSCGKEGLAMISGWSAAQLNEPDVLVVLINSARSSTFISGRYAEDWGRPSACEAITEGRRTAYDTRCEIKFENKLNAIKILRRRYDRMLRPEIITLWKH